MPAGEPGLQFVTSGTYQRAVTAATVCSPTSGTEFELPLIAANIFCTEDAMLSWVRYQFLLAANNEYCAYEWFILKCQSTAGIQDLSDSTVVEDLQREKRIFSRGLMINPPCEDSVPRLVKVEYFNVKLNRGEELRCVIRPLRTNGANTGVYLELLEWRQVGA